MFHLLLPLSFSAIINIKKGKSERERKKDLFSQLSAANAQSVLHEGLPFKASAHSGRTSNICPPDAAEQRDTQDLTQVNNNLWTAGVNLSWTNTSSDRMAN